MTSEIIKAFLFVADFSFYVINQELNYKFGLYFQYFTTFRNRFNYELWSCVDTFLTSVARSVSVRPVVKISLFPLSKNDKQDVLSRDCPLS
ncbi:hypothetical protein PTUN_b0072 [Pseudoalteromonas tunicata]|nr:hypothetical protein PTUN_b0072 [Pseudoalteromonas tunicata]